jgi:hypothetical protein
VSPDDRIKRAEQRAREDAVRPVMGANSGLKRKRHLAIGDPQAPLLKFLEILEHHRLLNDDGRLAPEVMLVSMGDHFDYGKPELREQATQDGTALLSWLAQHSADQVVIILGNHDLSRLGELHGLDDHTYQAARAEADLAYRRGDVDEEAEKKFLARWPRFPSAELASRDFSCFEAKQCVLVEQVVRSGRGRLAYEYNGTLLVHAGVTLDDLAVAGFSGGDAKDACDALQRYYHRAVSQWRRGPLSLEPLHRAGDAARGEGRGILYHRPADPELGERALFDGPPRRRFHPERLPRGFTQAIGHIRDGKCRKLLPRWSDPSEKDADGPLRSLHVDDGGIRYRRGVEPGAAMLFLDGGMQHVAADRYELLDLDTMAPAR